MRDLSNQEKQETQTLQKLVEKQKNENSALLREKEKLQADVNTLNEQAIELQEQVS